MRFHATVLATCAIATLAVGIAGASVLQQSYPIAKKADRLPMVAEATVPSAVTIEQRGDGLSIVTRTPSAAAN